MSVAASREELYDFEDRIEKAFEDMFVAGGLTVHKQRGSSDVATPYVAVQLQVGRVTGLRRIDRRGVVQYAAWNGTLGCSVVTNRHDNDSNHKTIRRKLRELVYEYQEHIGETELPLHRIVDAFETSTVPETEAAENFDISVINFQLTWEIREDAWPN